MSSFLRMETFFFSILNHFFQFQPLGKSLKFTLKNQHTFPESSFKFLVYLAFFTTECVLVFSRYPEFLTDPKSCWTGKFYHFKY